MDRDPAFASVSEALAMVQAGLLVLTLTGDKICAMTGFDTSVPPLFGLPRTLPG